MQRLQLMGDVLHDKGSAASALPAVGHVHLITGRAMNRITMRIQRLLSHAGVGHQGRWDLVGKPRLVQSLLGLHRSSDDYRDRPRIAL